MMTNNHNRPGPGRPPATTEKKVFDVMRPGKTPAQATSRPVIVGHKPQVKDPMMSSDRDSQKRSLMDGHNKVSLEPVAGGHKEDDKKQEAAQQIQGPSLADSLAPSVQNVASADSQKSSEPSSIDLEDSTAQSKPEAASEQPDLTPRRSEALPKSTIDDELSEDDLAALNEAAASISEDAPTETPPAPSSQPGTPFSTPLEHQDLLEEHTSTPNEQPSEEQTATVKIEEPGRPPVHETTPQEPAEGSPQVTSTANTIHELPQAPLPDDQPEVPKMRSNYHDPLPELPDEPAPQQIIVSHHNSSAGRNFMIGVLLLLFAIIIFDLLMDFGIFVIDGLPYTNFF